VIIHICCFSNITLNKSHTSWFDHPTNIWRRTHIFKLLILQSPPYPLSVLIDPNIHLSALFSKTLKLCSSLMVRDQVSQPYKIIGKIIVVVRTLIYRLLDGRREDKTKLIGSKYFPNVIDVFVNIILICYWHSRIFNFATASKDLLAVFELDIVLKYGGEKWCNKEFRRELLKSTFLSYLTSTCLPLMLYLGNAR